MEKSEIIYESVCRDVIQCEHYIAWEFYSETNDDERYYESNLTCHSCQLVGQSYNITEYNEFCPNQKILNKYHDRRVIEIIAHEKKCAEEKMWKILNE